MAIQRQSSIPLYKQIANELINKIKNNEFKQGEQLPTEINLIEQYDVSRLTIRKAINELLEADLITIQQGKGTFVKGSPIPMDMNVISEFHEMLSYRGKEVKIKLINKTKVVVNKEIADQLQCDNHTDVWLIDRVFIYEERPIGMVSTYISPIVDFDEQYIQLLEEKTLLSIFQDKLNIPANEVKYSIEAKTASFDLAKVLQVSLGYPLLAVKRKTLGEKEIPLDFTTLHLLSEFYQIKMSIKKGKEEILADSIFDEMIIRT